jgi:hypothetical protein
MVFSEIIPYVPYLSKFFFMKMTNELETNITLTETEKQRAFEIAQDMLRRKAIEDRRANGSTEELEEEEEVRDSDTEYVLEEAEKIYNQTLADQMIEE